VALYQRREGGLIALAQEAAQQLAVGSPSGCVAAGQTLDMLN
jgi:hypothetical protein